MERSEILPVWTDARNFITHGALKCSIWKPLDTDKRWYETTIKKQINMYLMIVENDKPTSYIKSKWLLILTLKVLL